MKTTINYKRHKALVKSEKRMFIKMKSRIMERKKGRIRLSQMRRKKSMKSI